MLSGGKGDVIVVKAEWGEEDIESVDTRGGVETGATL
jgi:hypothetical protein